LGYGICNTIFLLIDKDKKMSIEVKNLVKVFDDRPVINGISFKVDDGEVLAIVGFSGSGKSTVLKLICGLIPYDEGEIITSEGDIAMVFQYSALFDSLDVEDNISFALHERKELRKKYTEKQIKEIVAEKLQLVGLKGIESKFPSELSGGMQKRVSFARAIVTEPNIILYDEPTAGLDPLGTVSMMSLFSRLNREMKKTILIVTHDMEQVFKYCDRVVVVENGSIRAHMSVSEFFSDSALCRSMNILPPSIIRMKDLLKEAGFDIDPSIHDIDTLAACVARQVKKHG
jgi:ABC-type transporter Mla maintaining outer membrane lipid asymmetry ATPase subunit MlaF